MVQRRPCFTAITVAVASAAALDTACLCKCKLLRAGGDSRG
jgi:hypothetical protein